MNRRRSAIVVAFLYVWLMVGFATGTATLLGPAQWVTALVRGRGLDRLEDPLMWGVIAAFVVLSFLLSRVLVRRMLRTERRSLRWAIPGVATAAAAIALWGWTNPALYASVAGAAAPERVETASGAEFLFGPYPDRARLQELKDQGFTAVVSLQHPAVIPFEPQGIAAERAAAAELGIEFIHAPMLPWVSDNEASLAIIRRLASATEGKFYVHCGLGRDRVNVAKAVIERISDAEIRTAPDLLPPRTFADRVAEGRFLMERGNFQVIEPDLFLVPYPNEKEAYSKLFAGQVQHVMLILDPADAEQSGWLEEARELFTAYGVPHEHVVPSAASLISAAERVRRLPRPTLVIVPYTPPCPGAAVAHDFLRAYQRAGGPPIASVTPGEGDPHAEGRPLPCEALGS